jgi:hypothetical protein
MDYLKLGSPDKAMPFLQRALKLDPSNREAHEAMTLYYLGRDDFQSAAEEFRQLAALNLDKAEAWFRLGHQYLDHSLACFRGARLYKGSPWGHRFLGDLLFERGRWDDACRNTARRWRLTEAGRLAQIARRSLSARRKAGRSRIPNFAGSWNLIREMSVRGLAGESPSGQGRAVPALESSGQGWEISPEFFQLQHEFPSTELTQQLANASISQVLDQPEGAAKHFLLAGLYAAANENASFRSRMEVFPKRLIAMAQRIIRSADQDPCKANLYSRCSIC